MIARTGSFCEECDGGRISPGDHVAYHSDGLLIHTDCAEKARLSWVGTACPDCDTSRDDDGVCGCGDAA